MAARATALATRPGRRRLIVPNHHPSPTRRAKSVPNLRKGNAPHRCRAQTAPLPGDPRSPARSTALCPGRPDAHRLTYSPDDSFDIRIIFHNFDFIHADAGGVRFVRGTWQIIGGRGRFAGLQGAGTLINGIASHANMPPPAQFALEQYQGTAGY